LTMTEIASLSFENTPSDTLTVVLAGEWRLSKNLPEVNRVEEAVARISSLRKVLLDADQITDWDSGLLTFLLHVRKLCAANNIVLDSSSLPEGALKLLALASAVPEKKDARKKEERSRFLTNIGDESVELIRSAGDLLTFIGDAMVAFLRFLGGKAQFRRSDLALLVESCGAQALPIVTLICFLVGLILAFIGAIQLELFGAQIYVADLVGIAMVRLMAAIMTGIVLAGRTGGAFAAQLGTMQVNQEIDALRTLGIDPMEFLVLPRMLALGLMMPLLCLYANLMGILGGMVVGVGMLDIGLIQYYNETTKAVNLWNLGIGLFSGTLFGIIVALSGCMRGMQCGRSASSVGDAATSAVVTAIVGIIITTAMITLVCNILGI
jgi:phospholipid/cholesterol/gamma-HCH transport system permease protein